MKKPIRIVRKDKVAKARQDIASGAFDLPTQEVLDTVTDGILRDLNGK